MIKYRAEKSYPAGTIKKLEIERETEKFVIFERNREHKDCLYHAYFDTFEEAKQHLIDWVNPQIEQARARLQRLNGLAGNIKGLREVSL